MKIESLKIEEVESEPVLSNTAREGLRLHSLSLHSWRNYDTFKLNDVGNLTILVGPNAVGKTSIIEAVQMVTALKSFRTSHYGQMVLWGNERAVVHANLVGGGRDLDLRLCVDKGKRSYQLNGKSKRVQDLKGLLPAVTFCPDDLNLAKGSNAARRDALDGLGSQLSKNFYAVKSDYTKLIKQKNRALKDELPDAYIDSIDDLLVRVGVQLMSHRMVIVDKLRPAFQRFYDEITAGKEHLDFAYIPSWETRDLDDEIVSRGTLEGISIDKNNFDKAYATKCLTSSLAQNRSQERSRKKSVVGPHADKVAFLLEGRNALHYSSQGQQRSIVLAFKLAEASVIQETLQQKPLLLLDDVMSELDQDRRRYFMDFISDDIQTFITTTNEEYFDDSIKLNADVVRLKERDV